MIELPWVWADGGQSRRSARDCLDLVQLGRVNLRRLSTAGPAWHNLSGDYRLRTLIQHRELIRDEEIERLEKDADQLIDPRLGLTSVTTSLRTSAYPAKSGCEGGLERPIPVGQTLAPFYSRARPPQEDSFAPLFSALIVLPKPTIATCRLTPDTIRLVAGTTDLDIARASPCSRADRRSTPRRRRPCRGHRRGGLPTGSGRRSARRSAR